MTDLVERLLQVEGRTTECWYYRNPDGPEAADEIKQLRARVAELTHEVAQAHGVAQALEGDAERYRWLRDRLNVTFDKADMDPQLVWLDAGMLDDHEWQRAVDESIDRARTAPMKGDG